MRVKIFMAIIWMVAILMAGPVIAFEFNAYPSFSFTLQWVNPIDADFAGTMIRYSTNACPANSDDGLLVCNKENTPGSYDSFVHQSLTETSATYYYSAFSYDKAGNYSQGICIERRWR